MPLLSLPPFLSTRSFPQHEILENERPLPHGKRSATVPAGCLPMSRVMACVDFDYLIKGTAGWAFKGGLHAARHHAPALCHVSIDWASLVGLPRNRSSSTKRWNPNTRSRGSPDWRALYMDHAPLRPCSRPASPGRPAPSHCTSARHGVRSTARILRSTGARNPHRKPRHTRALLCS